MDPIVPVGNPQRGENREYRAMKEAMVEKKKSAPKMVQNNNKDSLRETVERKPAPEPNQRHLNT